MKRRAMMKPTPTLHDVARMAEVSTATVSRCFNFPDQVSEATRDRVMAVVKELGYAPNFGARAMAARRTNTIGAIIPTMENAVFARGLQAFQEELHASGYTMLVASSSYQADLEEAQIRALVARGADALLLIGHDRDPEIYRFLDAQGVPVLVAWAYDPALSRLSVGFDNAAAMQALTAEVIALGHRRLALISAEIEHNDRARARLDGVHAAMRLAGLAEADLTVVTRPYGIENGSQAFAEVMQASPTAVLCTNDVLALGALRRAREMGIAVPDDVSICGFDDIELAEVAFPPLTTVHVPHTDMGRTAAKTLVRMVRGLEVAGSRELKTRIVHRGTLGPINPALTQR
ncbi:LacI family DNA-binding transcriptional regulator [Yoonia sp. 2307UL14-13]|uniref:LacI family DNA-binding transcriptional regulator n=1 Tax=Yoonia sp. 2307UL14-13 TaxID=3126506 RepID=UPI0030958782